MYALNHAAMYAHIHCGNYKAAKAELEELVALANGAPFWKALATINEGLLLTVDGNEADAIKMFTSGRIPINRSNTLSATTFIIFSECLCESRPI